MPTQITQNGLVLTTFDSDNERWESSPVESPLQYLHIHTEIQLGTTVRDFLRIIARSEALRQFVNESYWCDVHELLELKSVKPPLMDIWIGAPRLILQDEQVVGMYPPTKIEQRLADELMLIRRYEVDDGTVSCSLRADVGVRGYTHAHRTESGRIAVASILDLELQLKSSSFSGDSSLGTEEEFLEKWYRDESIDNHDPLTFLEVIGAFFSSFGDLPKYHLNKTQSNVEFESEMKRSPMAALSAYKNGGLDNVRDWFLGHSVDTHKEIIESFEQMLERSLNDGTTPLLRSFVDDVDEVPLILDHLREWSAED